MPQSALSIAIYSFVGFFLVVIAGVTVLALFGKSGQERPETPEGRARREKIDAWQARRNRTMAVRLAGASWGFALGVLVSTLVKRRLPADEVRQLIPPFEGGPDKALQPTGPRGQTDNAKRREAARAADRPRSAASIDR